MTRDSSRHLSSRLAAAVIALAVLGSCSAVTEPEQLSDPVTYDGVLWQTRSPDYVVVDTAVGFQSEHTLEWFLTIGLDVNNPNGTTIRPRATVSANGIDTVTCQEEDLRRLPSLLASTDTWNLPCDGPLPLDPDDVTIVVTDDYS